jgi:hypothetical protein
MPETPRFIQGVFSFVGGGLQRPAPLRPSAVYTVPFDKRAQLVYLRAGNATAEMIYLVLMRGPKAMRYFAVGAKSAIHVPLAIVEDMDPESVIELWVGATEGLSGELVIDLGLLEI